MKRRSLLSILLGVGCFLVAQTQGEAQTQIQDNLLRQYGLTGNTVSQGIGSAASLPNPQLALSSAYYPVTAGDIYLLAYAAGTTPVTYMILVDTTYKVRVSNLAVIDAAGKSFAELKAQVETIVSKNYPLSGVQFSLSTPAAFRVLLKGEVVFASEADAWALTRLSHVVKPSVTDYSSLRDVTVTSLNGKTKSYDLFRAERFGELAEDPLLRPGDTITVNRLTRSVTVSGAVERPGTYQLLPGEGLKELVTVYAGGLNPLADPSRLELVRYIGAITTAGQKIFLNADTIESNFALENRDAVTVGEVSELIPVMFIEGAVTPVIEDVSDTATIASRNAANSTTQLQTAQVLSSQVSADPEASTRLTIRFNPGENYASLARRYRSAFTAVSDTASAYVIRGKETLPMNLNPMLYDASYRSEYEVQKDDVLIIPFRQYFVTVSGSVATPGRYPYIPDRDWEYYVALAGGFDTLENTFEAVTITDISGKKHKKSEPITPETVIKAHTNSFLFYFNQYAPVVTTTLTAISTFLTVYVMLNN